MYKLVILVGLIFSNTLYAKLNVAVSIAPIKSYIYEIAKDKVDITLLITKGSSAHNYSPKPSQMKSISKANLYFAIGVEFEDVWLNKFEKLNPKMKTIYLNENISKIVMQHHHHHKKDEDLDEDHEHENLDPHIWTSLTNVKRITNNILIALVKNDYKNKDFYENNYKNLMKKIQKLEEQVKNILKNTPKNQKFMVFHPSWQYFAKEYNLIQMPIELEGKNPKPKALQNLIKSAKTNNIHTIIVSPYSKSKMANIIAKQLNIKLTKVYPLNPNWQEMFLNIANGVKN